jgi:putative addiction module component (TIGR02574 family)
MNTLAKSNILNLSISERIQLVEDIWDSITEAPDSIPLTQEEKFELDRRLDAYHQNSNDGSPWDIVRERISNRA